MSDILFDTGSGVFSYRVAGIARRADGRVLLQRSGGDYAFIGGHVRAFETSADALIREFREELGARIAVGPLMAVGELFFPWGGRRCHQLGLYYAVELTEPGRVIPDGVFHGRDEAGGERFDLDYLWVDPRRDLPVYPPQVMARLRAGGDGVMHFVYEE